MKGYANTKQADRAMAAWNDMRKQGLKMNTVVYNSVIDAHARLGLTEQVLDLVHAMGKDGCELDVHTYSHIAKSHCASQKGDMDAAFKILQRMQELNMTCDSMIYNVLLDGCYKHGRVDLTELLIQEMDNSRVIPTNYTLGIIVRIYGRSKLLDKALEIAESVPKRYNFYLNSQVRTSLMVACVSNDAIEKALQVFEDMKSTHQGPDEKSYAVIIKGCVRFGLLTKAIEFIDEVYGLGSAPAMRFARDLDPECLEQLLKALKQKNMLEKHGMPLLERLRAAKVSTSRYLSTLCCSSSR